MNEPISVSFHPCRLLEDYYNNTHSYEPTFIHHFFDLDKLPKALKYVHYDIYYVVDTLEMFISVKGKVCNNMDVVDICEAITFSCYTFFTKLPEYSVLLSEELFKKRLYNRNSGTNSKMIPPGRILAEKVIDDGRIFQLRYCKFNDVNLDEVICPTENNNEQNCKSYDVVNGSHLYFPIISHDFKLDGMHQCLGNLSDEGDFDNRIVIDIFEYSCNLKFENKYHKDNIACECLDFSNQKNFLILHRRLEWFLHWFIETASNIEYDDRWIVIIPVIIQILDHADIRNNSNGHVSDILLSNDCLKNSILNRINGTTTYNIRCLILNEAVGKITNLVDIEDSGKHSNTDRVSYHINVLGIATAYIFFTLNLDKIRISQFMIFPNYRNKGFGLMLLELIYRMSIMDDEIRLITVEDPTKVFSTIRCIVSLKICFDSTLLDPKLLYSHDTTELQLPRDENKDTDPNFPTRTYISHICKENKAQVSRLIEILEIAPIFSSISSPDDIIPNANKRRKSTNVDDGQKFIEGSSTCIEYYNKLKQRIKNDEMKNISKISMSNIELSLDCDVGEVDRRIENVCHDTIVNYIRIIKKLSNIYNK